MLKRAVVRFLLGKVADRMESRFIKRIRNGKRMCLRGVMFAALITAFLTACGSEETEAVSPVVQIDAGGVTGSGIIFEQREDSLVIVTAAHVLQTATDTVEIIFADDYVAESASYTLSQTSDIAFADVPLETIPKEHLQKYKSVKTDKQRFDALTEGEGMLLRGIPDSGGIQEVNGTLIYPWIYAEDFNQYMMLIRGEILPGMSGGGAFDSAGNFAGVLCGVSETREIAAVPLSIILSEYSLIYE